jgi:hypothetical protein
MQFPGHAEVVGKSIWECYLAADAENYDFHFEMGGVETLHFWWQATTSGTVQIGSAAASGEA